MRISGSHSMHHKEFVFRLSEWTDLKYIYLYILISDFLLTGKKKSVSSWEENKFQNYWILCRREIAVLCSALIKCHLLNDLNSQ